MDFFDNAIEKAKEVFDVARKKTNDVVSTGKQKFDVATSRAVANMAVLSEFCMPYVKKEGYFVALKGPSIDEELENGRNAIKILGGELKGIIEISIEETDLKHNIVEVKKVKNCPKTYPRKAGTVNKKPLQ